MAEEDLMAILQYRVVGEVWLLCSFLFLFRLVARTLSRFREFEVEAYVSPCFELPLELPTIIYPNIIRTHKVRLYPFIVYYAQKNTKQNV